jgi:hypothetical protein
LTSLGVEFESDEELYSYDRVGSLPMRRS